MLKLSDWLKLKGLHMFPHLITHCSGISRFPLNSILSHIVHLTPPHCLNLLRQGHASMIAEAAASLGPDVKPGAVVISVGGGGLLCGVVQGLQDVGWTDVPIVAMETDGANCFNAAVKAGRLVTLDDITR